MDDLGNDFARSVLKEFLEGCLPDGVGGERKFTEWEEGERREGVWEGVERSRRVLALLAQCLREKGQI